MRRYLYILGIMGTITLSSCTNLDQSPYEFIAGGDAFDKINDAEYWVNGAYVKLRQNVYGEYMLCNDAQADILNATRNLDLSYYSNIHRWEPMTPSENQIHSIWLYSYNAIADFNFALDNFPKIKPKNDEERETLKQYTGELQLTRAYFYTRLITSFAKAYDQATAATDLGVPLEKVYNIKTQNKRASVKEVYDFILEDIANAENNLADKTNSGDNPDSFTIDAVKALKARVYLYMGRWEDAYQTAKALIEAGTYPLATSVDELTDIWYTDNAQESITQMYVVAPNQLPSSNDYYIRSGRNGISPLFIPSKWVVDLYDDADNRKSVYFKKATIITNIGATPDIYVVNKYPGNPDLKTESGGDYAHAPKVFRIAEQYLIASEAAFKGGKEGEAREYLNRLKTARGLTTVTLSGDALWKEIQNERLRELAFEGFRLIDLKRWNEGVVRRDPQDVTPLHNTPVEEYYELNRSANDYKFVWPIPTRDIRYGNLQQNPGW